MKLSREQRYVLAEAVSNIGVAWFAGGVIASVFTAKNFIDTITPSTWGFTLAVLFIGGGTLIAKSGR